MQILLSRNFVVIAQAPTIVGARKLHLKNQILCVVEGSAIMYKKSGTNDFLASLHESHVTRPGHCMKILNKSKGRKNNELNFSWSKMARLGPPFDPKIPPKKFMWVAFLRPSQEMRHINFSLGAKNRVFRVGTKKLMLKSLLFFSFP